MSKKTPETLRYPTDTEHLEVVTNERDALKEQIDFFGMSEMDSVNALVIYKFLLLQELLNVRTNLDVSVDHLKTLKSFQQFIDLISQELPYQNLLRLAIESLQNLLDPKKWRKYVEGGEQLITG